MGCHAVNLFRISVKLNVLSASFVAMIAVLFVLVWILCGALFLVLLKFFVIF